MSVHPADDTSPFARALATALEGQDAAYTGHPSQLKLRLTRLLGDDAHTYRRDLHLVVAALDENVPAELRASAPLTTADLERHAQMLAVTRGWTAEAAMTAVILWADALALSRGVAPGQVATGEADPANRIPASPVSPSSTDSPVAPASITSSTPEPNGTRPGRVIEPEATGSRSRTAGDDDASTVLPARYLDPMATDLPDRSSVLAQSSPLSASATPGQPSAAPGAAVVAWPSSSRFAIGQALQREGFPIGAFYAFRGRNPHLRYAAVGAFALLAAASVILPAGPPRMIVLLVLIASVLAVPVKLVRNGLMIVDDHGFRWYSALSRSGPPELAAPWSDVEVIRVSPPRLFTSQGDLWLKNRPGLLEAIESRVPSRTTSAVGPADVP